MPDCTSCGECFPFLTTDKCNGCVSLDNCETGEAKRALEEVPNTPFSAA